MLLTGGTISKSLSFASLSNCSAVICISAGALFLTWKQNEIDLYVVLIVSKQMTIQGIFKIG